MQLNFVSHTCTHRGPIFITHLLFRRLQTQTSNDAGFFILRTLWTFLLKTYEIFKSRKKQAIPQRFPIKSPSKLRSYKMKFLAKTHPNLARGNKM